MAAVRKNNSSTTSYRGMAVRCDQIQNDSSQVDVSDLVQLDGKVAVTTNATQTLAGATTFSNAVVKMTALPTADPHVVGVLWANSNVLTVSAG